MKILYISPYRQHDGWGLASRDYLMSLLSTEHEIFANNIITNTNSITTNLPPEILAAEQKIIIDEPDVIIQKSMPESMIMTKIIGIKNIGLTVFENNRFVSPGIANLRKLDELWVPSIKEQEAMKLANINIPVNAIGQPIDTSLIENIIKNDDTKLINNPNNSYVFYAIGEYIQRKNILDLILAYNLEFEATEDNVNLVIKTSIPGLDEYDAKMRIMKDISELKNKMRNKRIFHLPETIITQRLSNEDMIRMHKSCDCLVVTSLGEAFCRPVAEAACCGNAILASHSIGALDMLDTTDFYLIESMEVPVLINNPQYVGNLDIYNAEETWYQPSILSLRQQMRSAYNARKKISAEQYLKKFSYKNIGQHICQLLQ